VGFAGFFNYFTSPPLTVNPEPLPGPNKVPFLLPGEPSSTPAVVVGSNPVTAEGGTVFTIEKTGIYEISYTLTSAPQDSTSVAVFWLEVGEEPTSSLIPGSRALLQLDTTDENSVTQTVIASLTAGDVVSLENTTQAITGLTSVPATLAGANITFKLLTP
jgi:hypothetical protein